MLFAGLAATSASDGHHLYVQCCPIVVAERFLALTQVVNMCGDTGLAKTCFVVDIRGLQAQELHHMQPECHPRQCHFIMTGIWPHLL